MMKNRGGRATRRRISCLLWDCFVNWALTLEKIRKEPQRSFPHADLGAEKDIVDQMRGIPNVVEVHVVYGIYDILAMVEGESLEKVKEVITHRLRTLEKIHSTLTMLVVEESSHS